MQTLIVRILFVVFCAMLSTGAQAAEVWLTLMPYVHHFESRRAGQDWNSLPNGVGVGLVFERAELEIDAFRNSYGRRSVAASGAWRALKSEYLEAGVFAGVASGYRVPVVGGLYVQAKHGETAVRLLLLPKAGLDTSTAVAVQLRMRW